MKKSKSQSYLRPAEEGRPRPMKAHELPFKRFSEADHLNYLLQLEGAENFAQEHFAKTIEAAAAVPGVKVVAIIDDEIIIEGDEKSLAEFRKRCDLPA